MDDVQILLSVNEGENRLKPSENEESNVFRKIGFAFQKITVEPVICAWFMALYLTDSVVTNLFLLQTCRVTLKYNESVCSSLNTNTEEGHHIEALVQPYASSLVLCKSLISSLVPAFMSLFLGPWSDHNGRRLLILCPLLGCGMTYCTFLGLSYLKDLHPAYLLLSVVPLGLSGGTISVISAVFSYISDISKEEDRSIRLGLIEGLIFLSVLIGTASSSSIYGAAGHLGYAIIFLLGTIICFATFLYALFFLPETVHPSEENVPLSCGLVKEMFATFFKRRENNKLTVILLTAIALTITIASMEGLGNVTYLYTRVHFSWSFQQFITWSVVNQIVLVFGAIFGILILSKYLKISDEILMTSSYITKSCQCMILSLAPSNASYLAYAAVPVGVLGGITGPVCRSILSKSVEPHELGKIFSLTSSLEAIIPLAITPLYTLIYNLTINYFPGAFFMLSAVIYFTNSVFGGIICYLVKNPSSHEPLQFSNT